MSRARNAPRPRQQPARTMKQVPPPSQTEHPVEESCRCGSTYVRRKLRILRHFHLIVAYQSTYKRRLQALDPITIRRSDDQAFRYRLHLSPEPTVRLSLNDIDQENGGLAEMRCDRLKILFLFESAIHCFNRGLNIHKLRPGVEAAPIVCGRENSCERSSMSDQEIARLYQRFNMRFVHIESSNLRLNVNDPGAVALKRRRSIMNIDDIALRHHPFM